MKTLAFCSIFAATAAFAAPAPAPVTNSQFNLGTTLLNLSGASTPDGSSTNYAGIHGSWQYTMPNGTILNLNGILSPSAIAGQSNSFSSLFSQLEGRVGMQVTTSGGANLTPYLSVGTQQISSTNTPSDAASASQDLAWQYVGLGLQGMHAISPTISVGYHAKVFGHMSANQTTTIADKATSSDLGSQWGYEISMPIQVATPGSGVSVIAEPTLTKVDASGPWKIYGGKITLQKSF